MDETMVAIGLEVHAQVATQSKAFCDCPVRLDTDPNTAICPVCIALPGTLPVPNKAMVEKAVRLSLALGSEVQRSSRFDRKNYFYPDLPKGYQITQYHYPLALGGSLAVGDPENGRIVRIRRVHVEEDAARLVHFEPWMEPESCYVDFNRCGIPLVEIVTEPDIRSAMEAREFLVSLRNLLTWFEISDARMENGQFRCDVNISICDPKGTPGIAVEIKNLNSLSAVEACIDYEISRQRLRIDKGDRIAHETRAWDEALRSTRTMRGKEQPHDYRYFSDPDLPTLRLLNHDIDEIRKGMPEMPWNVRSSLCAEFNLDETRATGITSTRRLYVFFREIVKMGCDPSMTANWILGELKHLSRERNRPVWELVEPGVLADLLLAVQSGRVASTAAKSVLRKLIEHGGSLEETMELLGIDQPLSEADVSEIVESVIRMQSDIVQTIRDGRRPGAIEFLVGEVMKQSQESADPRSIRRCISSMLFGDSPTSGGEAEKTSPCEE